MKFRSAISHIIRGSGLAILFGIMLNAPAFGQGDIDQLLDKKFYYGPKGGINFVNIYNDSGPTGTARIGYSGGGFAHYQFLPWLGASLELGYMQMGSNRHFGISYVDGGSDAGANLITHNINAPLLAHLSLPNSGAVRPKIMVGPAFTYMFYAEDYAVQYLNLGSVVVPVTSRTPRTGEFSPFEVALDVGAGVDFSLGNLLLTGDIRHRRGFMNATDIVTGGAVSDTNNVFRGWQVSVGVGF